MSEKKHHDQPKRPVESLRVHFSEACSVYAQNNECLNEGLKQHEAGYCHQWLDKTNKFYSHIETSVFKVERSQVILPRQEWITMGDFIFPEQSFLPKVHYKETATAKVCTTAIRQENLRRLYASQSLSEVLKTKYNITNEELEPSLDLLAPSLTDIKPNSSAETPIGLQDFDDEELDEKLPEEWVSSGIVDGESHPVPGKAFIFTRRRSSSEKHGVEDKAYYWTNVAVFDYDYTTRLYKVCPVTKDDTEDSFQLFGVPRIYLYFMAEDPLRFAARVNNAFKRKIQMEENMRFERFLTATHFPDLTNMQFPFSLKFRKLIFSGKKIKDLKLESKLMAEVNENHLRVIKKQILREHLKTNPETFEGVKMTAPVVEDETGRGFYAKPVVTRIPDFKRVIENFSWGSLYVIFETYQALSYVETECLAIAELNLFDFQRNVTLIEFESVQTHTISNIIDSLNTSWVRSIAHRVTMCLRDVGRGWFNIKQSDRYVYKISKLARLMDLIELRMECAIRSLVLKSVTLYTDFIEGPCLCTYDLPLDFVWIGDLLESKFKTHPIAIFHLELVLDATETYNDQMGVTFMTVILNLMECAIMASHHIPSVKPFVLKRLQLTKNQSLTSVGHDDAEICALRTRLEVAVRYAIIPLKAYCRRYSVYVELYSLNVDAYIEKFNSENHPVNEVKDEIALQFRLKEELEQSLPSSIVIGPFQVYVEPVKKVLVGKRHEMATRLLATFAQRLTTSVEEVMNEYIDIHQKLNTQPHSIEHILEIKDWIETIPVSVKIQEDIIRRYLLEYEILDSFWWALEDEEFQIKWEAHGWPRKIQKKIEETLLFLEKETNVFKFKQLEDQSNLEDQLETINVEVNRLQMLNDLEAVHEIANDVRKNWKVLKDLQEFGQLLNQRQVLFGMPMVPYDGIKDLIREFEPYRNLWVSASDWLKSKEIYLDNPLENIDADSIDRVVSDYYKNVIRAIRVFSEIPGMLKVANHIKTQIDEFRPNIPLIKALKNPGLRQCHLDELTKTTGFRITMGSTLTYQKCLQLGISDHVDGVLEVSDNAAKEYVIEEALDKIEKDWEFTTLEVNEYKNTDTYIMKVADEVLQMLDDHTLSVQQLSFSPYKGALEKKLDEWEAKLRYNRLLLEEWMMCQKRWMWLEPIFTSEDITRQLPQQSKKFKTMDRSWRRIMKNASMNKNVQVICSDDRLFENLRECNKLLDLVERGLSDYLEMKRAAFPRFYFLSDDELLEILSQAKNPLAVQPHLRKCFENIQKLEFLKLDVVKTKSNPNPVDLEITKMFSAEGEGVELIPHMRPEGNVEQWLSKVEEVMRNTIRVMLGKALAEMGTKDRSVWVLSWPGQVVIACCQAYWTAQVENAILLGTLARYLDAMKQHLNKLRILVKGPLKRVERQVLSALIVIEVHARDVLTKLVDLNVTNCNEFDWISQLRYYWVQEEMKVRAVNAEFSYGYEYLGNSGRLVITPLTDRCYLTLTGALHLKFGGAPAGPAGTGKTETTKDLAKAFAIQCVVFNCSDQLDVRAMGKFFKGLASSGAWACFDEFNRIDIEVLSVVAQQITTIQKAQMLRADKFFFEGCELVLKASCSVFITMNPGYAGRTELPDNLKALFRPVAMMVPDYTLIAEISLFSFGFSEAKPLAGKITTTFKLSSEQLSSQDHYDFGMRAVNSVLAVAGNLKRDAPDLDERQIVLRAIRDSNVPKFLKDDLTLFNGIVSDLFPGMVEQEVNYGDLEKSIREVILQIGLVDVDGYVRKVIQLYETTVVRHGLMLVGPTGSGKTKCYEILKTAMTLLKGKAAPSGYNYETVHTYVLNPKSITMGQLYGEFDLQTHEWTDGILPSLMRVGASSADLDKHWYVLDGPVDAVWIENMNTVLDDNKKLCLTSGEIIKMSQHQTMMFEVADLAVASPATVSRCGMVYLEPGLLGLSPFLISWLNKIPKLAEPHADDLKTIVENWVEPAISFLRRQMKEMVHQVDSALFISCLRMLNCFLRPLNGIDGKPPPPPRSLELIGGLLKPWVIFSVIWSVGATCDYASRVLFSDWIRKTMDEQEVEPQFPPEGSVYDYRIHDGGFIMATDDGETCPPSWIHWLHDTEPYEITAEMRYPDIQVPTIDNVRNAQIIGELLENCQNVLCIGPTGSGKTITIMAKLSTGMHKKFISDFLNFSARTSANQTQDIIDAKLDRRRKGVFGPPITKRLVLFIDDLNMPAPEVYGAQPPLELLRQWMDFHGWYDRRSVGEFKQIVDTNLVAAMGPPGGARNPISPRLLRHFHLISFVEMQDDIKSCIFGKILNFWIDKIDPVNTLGPTVLASTIAVYSTILKELLPTPAKTHYTFNLRDLSKVFQGMLMLAPNFIKNVDDLLQLWYHENCRVYQDRLVNDQDRSWFDDLLCSRIAEDFAVEPKEVLGDGPLLYGDFVGTSVYKVYQPITDMIKLSTELDEFLDDYNSQSRAPMKLVLFLDAITHVCRISRIIRQPLGNGLLLGMAGSGRQSLTRLAAYMSEFLCFQIELTKSYSTSEWRDDIKQLMLKAGLHNRESVFLFADTQIKSESFLEDVNSILSSGDVPNIYQADELDKIYQAMQGGVAEAGLPTTRSNLYSFYLKLVRSNLHCVITMSPIGEVFRARLRQFPELVNCCTIDWFSAWPQSALQSVALQFLDDMPELDVGPEVQDGIVITFRYMHQSVVEASTLYLQELSRHNYVTPTSYLELLSSYGSMMTKKKEELQQGIKRLQAGLDKLLSTAQEVKVLQKELAEMKPKLEAAQVAADVMLKQIAADTAVAEETKAMVEVQEADALKIASEAQAIADDAAADLEQAMPLLQAAEDSLKALNRNDVTEVKAMKRPPAGVVLVIEVISIIMDIKPRRLSGPIPGQKILDYWEPGRNMLNDPGAFLNTLMNYDKENMSDALMNKLKPYINNPQFQPSKIITVSKACTSLCMWVHAIYKYYFVNQTVQPKKAALAGAKIKLASVMEVLDEKRARMKEVTDGLAELEKALKETMDHKAQLEANAKLCENRMDRAFRLINGLADERERWINTISVLERSVENMVGDILISAGAVAYLTPFTDKYRRGLLSEWLKQLEETGVPHTARCTPVQTLGEAVTIRQWQLSALPRDYLSTENAILSVHSRRWPLFIDPQGQANRWIKNIGKSTGLKVCKLTDKDLMRALQSAVRFGKEVLIENVLEELDPALDTILTRQTFVQNNQLVMRIGDLNVPYSETFRLYITTKLPNPHYMPEVSIKVLLVNFTLVPSGLEDQMLALVVMQERPDLEEERSAIVVGLAEMKNELKQIEDRILLKLSSSQGSPVDDIDLILTLEGSKVKSEEIKIKVEAAEITESNIEVTRRLYIPVAKRAQILFFCLADLALIDPMYQYSLEWFIHIFIQSTVQTEKSGEIEERVKTINDHFTFNLYSKVCQSLFEKNKLQYALLICARIMLDAGTLDNHEWMFFLAGGMPKKDVPNPAPSWLPARAWQEILSLSHFPVFKDFAEFFSENAKDFKKIFDSAEPQRMPLPGEWNSKLDDFEKMMILKCLRPDKVTNAMQQFLVSHLGQRFIEPRTTDVEAMFCDSNSTTPLIFVLSTGTDPAADLYKFADKSKMTKRMLSISLGQGQGPIAEGMLLQSIEIGNWIFFQNCHLAPSWMPRLEYLIDNIPIDIVHRDFRVWLTSAPSPSFPVSILQNGSKMTVEPPRGIKANMLRAFTGQVMEYNHYMISGKPKVQTFKWLLFSLCLFHGACLERRKFGPLGFNIPYEFTDGDLRICISQLQMFIEEYSEVPFKVLSYTAGEINYGGRVTDDWDRRCIMNVLADFYKPEVLDEGYSFDGEDRIYHQLPEDTAIIDYVTYIRTLPVNDSTVLFGLHSNADISSAQAEGYRSLGVLLSMQPKVVAEKANDQEDVTAELAQTILESIPQARGTKEIAKIQKMYPVLYQQSLNTVLVQEVIRFEKLLIVIHSTLNDLLRALKGLAILSEELEKILNSLFTNSVPNLWASKAYPSLKHLGAWVSDLQARIDFINRWIEHGVPSSFWISGFYFPQAFLTGCLQNYARRKAIAIDSITYKFMVLDAQPKKAPVEGCVIHGLFLEGARWNSKAHKLDESFPKELYINMNPIWLIPTQSQTGNENAGYRCPVYKTLKRAGVLSTTGHSTNYVLAIDIPTDRAQSHWIKRGVALICALDF